MKIGTIVKTMGKYHMEYGIIVKTSKYPDGVILWDTDKIDDYEEWHGATFLEVVTGDYQFSFINKDGSRKD